MMSLANRYAQLPVMKAVCLLCVISAGLLAGCDTRDPDATQATEPGNEETLSTVSEEGPVTATVTLSPESPRLGDPLTLTLTVAAEADVTVEMPAFGEALGRFSIIDFVPRREIQEDGSLVASQRYRLESPMSGRQRIPGLRIEYVDGRSGSTSDDYQELITDELSIEVESVLPEGDVVSELRPARGPLPELTAGWRARWPSLLAAIIIAASAVTGFVIWQRRSVERARVSAFDHALARLRKLETRGLPDAGSADAWYVELSDITRRYIEDRYAVRAPELTTEEFLQEARLSVDFTPSHRDLLTTLLERCDRVKFAAYSPPDEESRDALDVTLRFLSETRATGKADEKDSVEKEAA